MSATRDHLAMNIGIHPNCGGAIRVKDWRTHDELRYEAWCDKCRQCDPNGYGSRRATIAGAREYFQIAGKVGRKRV